MMSNLLRRFGFLCLVSLTFAIFGVGCTSEEEKDTVVNPPVTSEPTDAAHQDTAPPPVEPKKEPEPEKPLPPIELPETKPKSTSPEAEKDDDTSAESGPPAEFTLVSSLWETHTKGAPTFTHEKHSEIHKIECNECHHIYESGDETLGYVDGENMWREGMPVDKCSKCHDEPTIKNEKKLPPAPQKKNLKLAFHNNCRACHKALKKEDPETKAPVTCKQCHPKK